MTTVVTLGALAMSAETYIWVVAAMLVAYPFLMIRLVRFIEPLRLEMAELGEQLAVDEYLTAKQKSGVQGMLNDAYNPFNMVILTVLLPVCLVWALVDLARGRAPTALTRNAETECDYDHFMRMFLASSAAANPIFGLLFVVELLLVVLVAAIVGQQISALRTFIQLLVRADLVVKHRSAAYA